MPDHALPELYKYRSVSSDRAQEAIRQMLVHSALYWQNPTSFNDPFDCVPRFIYGRTVAERTRYLRDLNRRKAEGPRSERRQAFRRLKAISPNRLVEIGRKAIARNLLTCFSTKRDCLLMWAHYAEEHRGVCFRFRQIPTREGGFFGFPVRYSEERPVADLTKMVDDDNKFFKDAVLTKAKCWEYESEHRMIERGPAAGYKPFPPEALTGVILGARMDEQPRADILNLVREHRPDIDVLQAEFNDRSYALNLSAVKIRR